MIFHSTEQETVGWKFFWHQRIRISMNIKANIIRPNRNGFTLIEILVVLIILGVLA
ncbi:MAG: type II secretion system protein [Desulfobacterales bacterium]